MSNKYITFINDANKICTLKGVKIDGKSVLAINLLNLCNEHVRSIATLLNLRLEASAMALFRSGVEALIRGLWVFECLELSKVSKYAESDSNSDWPSFDKMIQDIDLTTFDRYKGRSFGLMNSFTHGTSQQILRSFDGKVIHFSLTRKELNAVYTDLALLSYEANVAIALIANEIEKADLLKSLWREVKSY